MEIKRYGEKGIRVVFGSEISTATSDRIRRFHLHLKSLQPKGLIDIIPSFTTCLIVFDNSVTSFDAVASILREEERALEQIEIDPPAVHDIPVAYGGTWGPDMGFVASHCHLTADDIITIHTSSVYTVFTIGFLPGFPYLGTLDRRLDTPRLETPRLRVPEGSVGIAQLQTGIYTFESPGGYRIIGRTEKKLFDYTKSPYSLMRIGDRVRFIPA